MNKRAFLLVAVLLSFAGSSAFAGPISFNFSFHDYSSGSDVTGIVEGLNNDGTYMAATSVFVLSNSLGFGIGEYVGTPLFNIWSVRTRY